MRLSPNLWIVTLDAPSAHADAVSDMLGEGAVSQAILSPPGASRAIVEAIFDHEPDADDIQNRLQIFSAVTGIELGAPTVRPSPQIDWLKKVAEDFPPMKIGRWTVHGAYHRREVSKRLLALQVDSSNAFGTGGHPSTQGCLLMLNKILKTGFKPRRMADIGCGSGILSMACVKATRGIAVAVDLDPECVQVAARNARANGCALLMHLRRSRGYAHPLLRLHAPYDLIMTNLFTRPLVVMAKDVGHYLRPGGIAILAGILNADAKIIIAAHRMQGLSLIEHNKIGDWSVLAFRR